MRTMTDDDDKRLRDTRDCLFALLDDMFDEAPGPVTLSELDGAGKVGLLATCCAEMIVMALRATATDRQDALRGLELLVGDMRARLSSSHLN
jgi:hypothetical protein